MQNKALEAADNLIEVWRRNLTDAQVVNTPCIRLGSYGMLISRLYNEKISRLQQQGFVFYLYFSLSKCEEREIVVAMYMWIYAYILRINMFSGIENGCPGVELSAYVVAVIDLSHRIYTAPHVCKEVAYIIIS